MTNSRCEICRGSGLVRLPIYRTASVTAFDNSAQIIEESARNYPCPECADLVPQERLALVQYHSLVDARCTDQEYIEAANNDAAHMLVGALLKGGFIRFEHGKKDARRLTFPVQATIGVVSTKHVATMEERIAERQDTFACEVIAEAALRINEWGSSAGTGAIYKTQAIDELSLALRRLLSKRKSHPHQPPKAST